ncbi:hypothetical protein UT300005_03630 [Clostridium sp. CTA-5]
MRIAISVNVNEKDAIGYNLIDAYNENEILPFAIRKATKGLTIGDIVYMWLTKPISNFRYKCEVVGVGANSKDVMDDRKYQYHPEKRKKLIDDKEGYYLIKKIKQIDSDKVTLEVLRSLGYTNMKQVQCCCKDKEHSDMFDYLDKLFDIVSEPK